jgi:Asp/Glu/hydantoin racemase
MKILIINPNSDPEMTAAIQKSAENFGHRFIRLENDQRSLYTFPVTMLQTERKSAKKGLPEVKMAAYVHLGLQSVPKV